MTLYSPNLTSDTPVEGPVQSQELIFDPAVRVGFYGAFFKRAVDLVLVLISLPVALPIIAVLALLIAATGNMPFFTQPRVGQNGMPFRMWKLRTMVKGADEHLEAYLAKNPEARREWDATQKLKNDPRITPFGRLLRKTSIDELPQLFNVLGGTMSLVGPRPMMVGQEKDYIGHAYYDLRPGVTGTWQISERNDCTFQRRAILDETYSRNISLRGDLRILFKTVSVVCRATGH